MGGRERRKFPRYDIAGLEGFTGEITLNFGPCRVGMLGIGGCGFYVERRNPLFVTGCTVECRFTLEGVTNGSVAVEGQIIYKKTFTDENGQLNYFYGVEFYQEKTKEILPLIQYFEELERAGKIKLAV